MQLRDMRAIWWLVPQCECGLITTVARECSCMKHSKSCVWLVRRFKACATLTVVLSVLDYHDVQVNSTVTVGELLV